MRYAAFDISSKTGWGVWDGHAPQPTLGVKTIVGWDYDAGSMLELYRKWLGDFLRAYRPQRVGIEALFLAPHLDFPTIGKQVALVSFTQWACKAAGVPCSLIYAASWRKSWYGSARGRTDDFKNMAVNRCLDLGWDAPDHNAAEAGGILDHLVTEIGKETPPWRSSHLLMPEPDRTHRRAA